MGRCYSEKLEFCSNFVSERELIELIEQERLNAESELSYNPTNEEVMDEVISKLKEEENLYQNEEELLGCIKGVFKQYSEESVRQYMKELYITKFPQYRNNIRQGFLNYKIGNISEEDAIEWLGELCSGDEDALYWELEHHSIKTKYGYVHA